MLIFDTGCFENFFFNIFTSVLPNKEKIYLNMNTNKMKIESNKE